MVLVFYAKFSYYCEMIYLVRILPFPVIISLLVNVGPVYGTSFWPPSIVYIYLGTHLNFLYFEVHCTDTQKNVVERLKEALCFEIYLSCLLWNLFSCLLWDLLICTYLLVLHVKNLTYTLITSYLRLQLQFPSPQSKQLWLKSTWAWILAL